MEMKQVELDSLQLIWALIASKKRCFIGVEMIAYSICIEAAKMFFESIVESFVSVYENRNN